MPLLASKAVASRRVLIVDDYFATARSMAVLLEMCGCVVEVAFDPSKTLEVARKFKPDVVLLDLEMPEVNAFDLARSLKRAAHAPLIAAWTVHEERRYRQQAQRAGIDHYLVKPTSVVELVDLLSSGDEN